MSRLTCTSRKFPIRRLAWIVILRRQSLNTFTIAFPLRYVCGSERFRKAPSASSLYNPTDSLQNKCLTPKIICRANVENDINDENNFYFRVSETPFKESFRNHKKEFDYAKYRNSTELSKYIWQLKVLNMKTWHPRFHGKTQH